MPSKYARGTLLLTHWRSGVHYTICGALLYFLGHLCAFISYPSPMVSGNVLISYPQYVQFPEGVERLNETLLIIIQYSLIEKMITTFDVAIRNEQIKVKTKHCCNISDTD